MSTTEELLRELILAVRSLETSLTSSRSVTATPAKKKPESNDKTKTVWTRLVSFADRIASTENSFEDYDTLLQTILTINTFTGGFAFTLVATAFSEEDFVNMDTHFVQGYGPDKWANEGLLTWWGVPEDPSVVWLPSYTFIDRGLKSVTALVISLLLSVGAYLSLMYSDCRENEEMLMYWGKNFKFVIVASFALYLYGFALFLGAMTICAYVRVPKYCGPYLAGAYGGVFAPRHQVWNETSQSLIVGCSLADQANFLGGNVLFLLNSCVGFLVVGLLAYSIAIHVAYYGGYYGKYSERKGNTINGQQPIPSGAGSKVYVAPPDTPAP